MSISTEGFTALQEAVRLARDEQIRTLAQLRRRLIAAGHDPVHIEEAITTWSTHAQRSGRGV